MNNFCEVLTLKFSELVFEISLIPRVELQVSLLTSFNTQVCFAVSLHADWVSNYVCVYSLRKIRSV